MSARLKGLLLLLVALAGGIAIGASLTRYRSSGPITSPMDPANVLRTLTRELSLDSAQRAAVGRVLKRRHAAIDSAWLALRPAVRAAVDSSQMEIVNVLRPDQRAKYMELMQRAHASSGMMRPMP